MKDLRGSTQNSKVIKASAETIYRAFTDPAALAVWFAPGEMTAEVHHFEARVGGGYEMSLYYPASEESARGKTADKEDRYTAQFVELTPPRKIVEVITFDTDNASFAGEMRMEVTLKAEDGGTRVTVAFKDIPAGVRPEDNEKGTELSL